MAGSSLAFREGQTRCSAGWSSASGQTSPANGCEHNLAQLWFGVCVCVPSWVLKKGNCVCNYMYVFPRVQEAAQFVNEELINPSIDNWRTRWYDKYQMCCLGIM